MWRDCVQANTHGTGTQRVEAFLAAARCAGREPICMRAMTSMGVTAWNHVVELGVVVHQAPVGLAAHRGERAPRTRSCAGRRPRPAARAPPMARRERIEGALQRAHRDGPQAVALVDDLALLGEAQHTVDRAGRGGRRTSESMRAAAARDAAAARMEDDVALVGRGQRRGQIRLRAVDAAKREAQMPASLLVSE